MYRVGNRQTLILGGLAITGIILVLFATYRGAGLTTDSIHYTGAARNVVIGSGITLPFNAENPVPMTHFPPLFSLLLAVPGLLGIDPIVSARFINAAAFGVNILLAGIIIFRVTGSSKWSAAGAFFVLLSVGMVSIHAMALTEPLFVTFTLGSLLLLALYLETGSRALLVAAAVIASLAFLQRYVGITVVGAGVVALLLFHRKRLLPLLVDIGVFSVVSVLPVAAWLVRNILVAETHTSREFGFHPIGYEKLREGFTTVSEWILPGSISVEIRFFIFLIGLLTLTAAGVYYIRKKKKFDLVSFRKIWSDRFLEVLLITFITVYTVFLLVSISVADAYTPLNNRILSPIYICLLILVFVILHGVDFRLGGRTGYRMALLAGIVLYAMFFGFRVYKWSTDAHDNGVPQTFIRSKWANSELIEQVRILPSDVPILTNGDELVYHFVGRQSLHFPLKYDPKSKEQNENYTVEIERLVNKIDHRGMYVVFFHESGRDFWPTESDFQKYVPLKLVNRWADGAIYHAVSVKHAADPSESRTFHPLSSPDK